MSTDTWIEWTPYSIPPGIAGDEFVVLFNGTTRGIAHWDVSGVPDYEEFYWWSKEVRDGAKVTHYLPHLTSAIALLCSPSPTTNTTPWKEEMNMSHPLTCEMRALSHEQLAIVAANLALALEDIFHNRVDSAIESADRALRNTGVLAIQALVCDEAAEARDWRESNEANRRAEGAWEDAGAC